MSGLEVGINILGAEALYDGRIRSVLDLAAEADRAGIDLISTGDHLGFTAGVDQSMVTPVIIGKLVAGITALIVANLLAPKLLAKIDSAKQKA